MNGPRTPIFYAKGIKAYICKRDTFHRIRTNSTLVESVESLTVYGRHLNLHYTVSEK